MLYELRTNNIAEVNEIVMFIGFFKWKKYLKIVWNV